MSRSLVTVLLGLLVFAVLLFENGARVSWPERPYSMILLLPSGLCLLGALTLRPGKYETGFLAAAVFRLQATAVAVFFLTPFFVWHFSLYEHPYFVLAGAAFLLSFQGFLISLGQVMQIFYLNCRQPWSARVSRFLAISVVPLTCTVTVIVYLHVFRVGPEWVGVPLESPYSVWMRVTPWFRGLFVMPYLALAGLLAKLTLLLPEGDCGQDL